MKYLFVLLFLSACATGPKCPSPKEAGAVYSNKKTCEVRIRQVVIGSKMNVPESLKGPELAGFELTWIESKLVDGQIQLGHFALIPKGKGAAGEN